MCRPVLLAALLFLTACAPGDAQLRRFESRGESDEGVTELDGGVEMLTPTSITVRPVGAARVDFEEVSAVSQRPAVTVHGDWTETIVTDDLAATVRIELQADARPLAALTGEQAESFEVDGSLSVDTASVDCTSYLVRTRCGLTGVVDARVSGLLSIVGDDATLRLEWRTFGSEQRPARPEVTLALWPVAGRSAPIWEHDSDAVAWALEQAGVVGASLALPSWPAGPRELQSATGTGKLWIEVPDR